MKLNINNIEMFIFDFDGVLTNNLVFVDENGKESISCNRADGIAFEALRKLNKTVYILSTEKNKVVLARANKLKIKAINKLKNKEDTLKKISKKHKIPFKNILYVGNDINDLIAMQMCKFRACPSDSHKQIRKISNIIIKRKGGDGVARELLENNLSIDLNKILYNVRS